MHSLFADISFRISGTWILEENETNTQRENYGANALRTLEQLCHNNMHKQQQQKKEENKSKSYQFKLIQVLQTHYIRKQNRKTWARARTANRMFLQMMRRDRYKWEIQINTLCASFQQWNSFVISFKVCNRNKFHNICMCGERERKRKWYKIAEQRILNKIHKKILTEIWFECFVEKPMMKNVDIFTCVLSESSGKKCSSLNIFFWTLIV